MKNLILVFAFLSFSVSFSQEEKAVNEVVKSYQEAYNNSNYEGIFDLYNSEYQSEFTKEKTITFHKRIKSINGQLTSFNLKRVENKLHVYNAVFEKRTTEIIAKIDKDGKAIQLMTRNTVTVK